mgnify:CR=1 FL=1|tara:strand:+ start:414 stop:821 length:408 start_codon:yes stop_codon:yes gene_type:complete
MNFLDVPKKNCRERGCIKNKNSEANYCLEQEAQHKINQRHFYINNPNGYAYSPAFPELYNPGHTQASLYSFNAVDIESDLFNIGCCNLVENKPPVNPQFKQSLPEISFFKKPKVIQQKEFVHLNDQRPFICPMYS